MLTTGRRSSLYNKLVPVLGEEDTAALLDQYPAHELEEPATKAFLRAELAETREQLRADLAETREGLRAEMHGFREALGGEIAGLRLGMAEFEAGVAEKLTNQTRWLVATVFGSLAIFTAIVGVIT